MVVGRRKGVPKEKGYHPSKDLEARFFPPMQGRLEGERGQDYWRGAWMLERVRVGGRG